MKKDMFFDYFGEDCFAAVTENGKVVEFHLDTGSTTEISGNVYKGRVVNVLEGMQAAFVDFGQAKNGYLYAGDIPAAAEAGAISASGLNVQAGDEVMVQVSKSPIGSKGARLSMCLSFVGKRLIFLPTADFCAVSRKITDEAVREELLAAAQKLSAGARIRRARSRAICARKPNTCADCTNRRWKITARHPWAISCTAMPTYTPAFCAISISPM